MAGIRTVIKFFFSIPSHNKNDNIAIHSPLKHKPDTIVSDLLLKPHCPSPFNDVPAPTSSKDETFFDSQPWLESDREDDYFSVKGDFTPSRGSTPVHHNFFLGNLLVNKAPPPSVVESNPSPPQKRKSLSELFKENLFRDTEDEAAAADNKNNEAPAKAKAKAKAKVVPPGPINLVHPSKSVNGTPNNLSRVNSGRSSGTSPNKFLRAETKSVKAQCCLPRSLLSGHRLKEKNRGMRPAAQNAAAG